MAEWFTQNRYDIDGLSAKSLIEWARDEVDTARHFARLVNPEHSPADILRDARSAVEMVFNDGPAAVVMAEAGLLWRDNAQARHSRHSRFNARSPMYPP